MNMYWMVHRAAGGGPVVKHDSEEKAQAEAARLAEQNPGDVFAVLAVVAAYLSPVKPVERITIIYPARNEEAQSGS